MGPASFVTRWWNAVRPLPGEVTEDAAILAQKRKQSRLIIATILLLGTAGVGWYVYDYISSAPDRARVEFDKGVAKMNPRSYPEAIRRFDRALQIWPRFAEAHLNRALAEHNLSQREEALADLDKAIELNPNLTRAYDERGRIYAEKGDLRRAVEEFSKSLKIVPTTNGFYQRGLSYSSLGQYQKAIEDFDKAIEEMVDAPYAYRARAQAKYYLGDTEGARADWQRALDLEKIK